MTRLLETGDIYFVYRPRTGAHPVRGLEDVAALYVILHPYGRERYRLLRLARRTLPETSDVGQLRSAVVESIGRRAEDIEDQLDLEVWGTRGGPVAVRRTARPAGEGVYGLVRHEDHTHLAYVLELPARAGSVQRAFRIEAEASYLIIVQNGGRAFVPLDPADLLDHEGVEILLAAAGNDVWPELGIPIDLGKERAETADIFRDLRLEQSMHPTGPLLKGEWE